MKFIERLLGWIGWIQIFILPSSFGGIVGFATYNYLMNVWGVSLGILSLLIGFAVGFLWAEKIRQKGGTVKFLSKVNASPDVFP